MHRPVKHDPYRSTALLAPQLPDLEPGDAGFAVLDDSKRLKIAAVVDRYPPWKNAGAEWMLHSILRRLVEWGHECDVSTAMPGGVDVPTSLDGVTVWPYDAAQDLVEACDVMVGHLLWTREAVGLAVDAGKPLMYLLHNDRQVRHWNLDARNVTVLVPNSEWVAKASIDDGWRGPMFVCRPPVFCADYALPDVGRDHRRFVTLVNAIPEKGRDVFNELAKRLGGSRFLAVEGAYGSPYRVPYYLDNVEVQPQTANMRDDVYARTAVQLVPSQYESWGRVAVEAMAAGVPVLAHPTPGLLEACGDAAQFVEHDNIDGYEQAVRRLLTDKRWWRRWSEAGKARAAELETVTDGDLLRFERWAQLCAEIEPAERVPTGPMSSW